MDNIAIILAKEITEEDISKLESKGKGILAFVCDMEKIGIPKEYSLENLKNAATILKVFSFVIEREYKYRLKCLSD